MSAETVAVVVVGYNSKSYLQDCFESIYRSTYSNIRGYFVDNNSSDGSLEFVAKRFPAVHRIENKENLGFATGNNLGVQLAIREGCQYVFLLNPDTVIDESCLLILVRNASSNTILQPLIQLYENGKTNLLNTSGNILHFLGFSYVGGYREDYRSVALPDKLSVASGAAMFIPVGIIKKIGLFEESFFMYHEDVDFSWRARKAGFDIKLLPKARIWHKYHFSRNSRKYYFVERNRWLFIMRNYQVRTILIFLPMLLLAEITLLFFALINGFFREKLAANQDAIKQFKKARRFYREFASKRIYSDKELYKYFSGRVSFKEVENSATKLFNVFSIMYWELARHI